jgi:hypothetical protein
MLEATTEDDKDWKQWEFEDEESDIELMNRIVVMYLRPDTYSLIEAIRSLY